MIARKAFLFSSLTLRMSEWNSLALFRHLYRGCLWRASFTSDGSVCLTAVSRSSSRCPMGPKKPVRSKGNWKSEPPPYPNRISLSPIYAEENEFKLATEVSLSRLGLLTCGALYWNPLESPPWQMNFWRADAANSQMASNNRVDIRGDY